MAQVPKLEVCLCLYLYMYMLVCVPEALPTR